MFVEMEWIWEVHREYTSNREECQEKLHCSGGAPGPEA